MTNLTETAQWEESIFQIDTTDPVIGGAPDAVTKQGLPNIAPQQLANRTQYLKTRLDELSVRATATHTVGAGGDFATINAALAYLSERRPAYTPNGFRTEIKLLPGFVMQEQVLLRGINFGWVSIVAVDGEVTIDRAALTDMNIQGYPAFGSDQGGYLPQIDVQFVMSQTGDATNRHGIEIGGGSGVRVGVGCGIRGAGGNGAYLLNTASLTMSQSDFSGAGGRGLLATGGAAVVCEQCDFSGAGLVGLDATNTARVHANGVNATSGGVAGIRASSGAQINAAGASARRAVGVDGSDDIRVHSGGVIGANSATGGTNVSPNTVTANGIIFK